MEIEVIAEGRFQSGADVLRSGEQVYRVPQCTRWDDPHVRVVALDGLAVVQEEVREFSASGNRSFGTGEWTDIRTLGPAEGLVVKCDEPA